MDKFKIKIKAVVQHENRFLIVKKWYDDRIAEPYQWEFLDGDMIFGEQPERAAERIVREQTQLEVGAGRFLYPWSYVVGDVCYVGICYLFETAQTEVFLSEELLEACWELPEKLNEYTMNKNVLCDIMKAVQ